MSGSNCCFLTCIQVSQKTGRVACFSYLFKNFPQFIVIHTVKGFSIVSEAEIDVSLEFPCFLHNPMNVGNLISGVSLVSLNPDWISGSSWFTDWWSLAWRILSINLLVCEMSTIIWYLEHFLALPFFGLEWKLTFSSPLTVLCRSNLLAYWVQHFHSIVF